MKYISRSVSLLFLTCTNFIRVLNKNWKSKMPASRLISHCSLIYLILYKSKYISIILKWQLRKVDFCFVFFFDSCIHFFSFLASLNPKFNWINSLCVCVLLFSIWNHKLIFRLVYLLFDTLLFKFFKVHPVCVCVCVCALLNILSRFIYSWFWFN